MKALLAITIALTTQAHAQDIRAFFSPNGGCTAAICNEISHATNDIKVQAYSFTSASIRRALTDAHKRGVKVAILLDKSQKGGVGTEVSWLQFDGITPLMDRQHAIAHNKVIIIDNGEVITGSFNFSHAAETTNAENVLILQNKAIAGQYISNWNAHAAHSKPYTQRERSTH